MSTQPKADEEGRCRCGAETEAECYDCAERLCPAETCGSVVQRGSLLPIRVRVCRPCLDWESRNGGPNRDLT